MAEEETAPQAEKTNDSSQIAVTPAPQDNSMRTLVLGSFVIVCLFAIYMINIMNDMRVKMDEIKQLQANEFTRDSYERAPQELQLVDKDGNLAYSIVVDPQILKEEREERLEYEDEDGE